MPILINGIETALEEQPEEAVSKALRLFPPSQVINAQIAKTSLDARHRSRIRFVHSVAVYLENPADEERLAGQIPNASLRKEEPLILSPGTDALFHRPVIAGFGPAGMFAGLLLARYGYRPLILERGAPMEERVQAVERFWKEGELDERTNVQFGEGGAGTFSDGKLTTRIGDPKCGWVLRQLREFGAPEEILYRSKPHIGTDRLRGVVSALRAEILRLGGEISFYTPLTDLRIEDNRLKSITAGGQELPAQALILAVGHSARDTFAMLQSRGVPMEAKPFSVGVRIEHLQTDIDQALYGRFSGHPALPVGEYQLSMRENGRGVYTFCMCPGGTVVPSASENGMVVTNGMSCYIRDGVNANSALVVSVDPNDYGTGPLDGIEFQRRLERTAFQAGGGGYRAPAQSTGNFLTGRGGIKAGRVSPSYSLGVTEADFHEIFPPFITVLLQKGLLTFEKKLCGFAAPESLLTGVESRTSSPVRVLRRETDLQSPAAAGLYPCAEGAGYAGGIMSAAVDGLRVAMQIINSFKAPA